MNTTLNEIKAKHPCSSGWDKLLDSLGKSAPDNEPLSFKRILESNGIQDAVWALCVLPYDDRCLFSADVAESVLHIFENRQENDERPRKAIQTVRDYKAGLIARGKLAAYAYAAAAAAAGKLDYAAAYADAAYAAAYAAADAAADAADAYAAAEAAADAAADAAAAADARKKQWKITEELFIKHFCAEAE
jgi:hypothetical protein